MVGDTAGNHIHCGLIMVAVKTSGILIIHIHSAFLCFANANSIKERIMMWVNKDEQGKEEEERNAKARIQVLEHLMVFAEDDIDAAAEALDNVSPLALEWYGLQDKKGEKTRGKLMQ
uniref:Uncharacterized protein n=1 Tax=Nelumbo nucifera TaxID=4432 RepID=A0A822YWA1_NELNU|nr:TPA_asm: hypothetical protein HUJ06_009005 [Nelumbo nucifera]